MLPYVEENLFLCIYPKPTQNYPINFDSSYLIYIPPDNWTPYADTVTYSVSNRSMWGNKPQKVFLKIVLKRLSNYDYTVFVYGETGACLLQGLVFIVPSQVWRVF